jgi:hypothetical protein
MLKFFQNKWVRKCLILVIILSFIGSAYMYIYISRTNMPTSQVFVCDNPKHHSDFDDWILNECGVKWVPSYIIIYNDTVIGTIDGNIKEEDFTSKLGTIIINGFELCKVPNYEITNLDGNSYTLSELTPKKDEIYILEISWANCEDCELQDELYTNSIYWKYSTNNIIRYYINSEKYDVKELY